MIVQSLLAIPTLVVLLMLQMAVFSRLPLLGGTIDAVLLTLVAWALNDRVSNPWLLAIIAGLMVGSVSALPIGVTVAGYLAVVAIARIMQRRVWQMPVLAMFVATILGTIVYQSLSIAGLIITGVPIGIIESIRLVSLPSTLLNLIVSLPVFVLINDLVYWLYPVEVDL